VSCNNYPKPDGQAQMGVRMFAQIGIDILFFSLMIGSGYAIGYYTGRGNERDRNQMVADLNRVKMATKAKVYDWEKDGI